MLSKEKINTGRHLVKAGIITKEQLDAVVSVLNLEANQHKFLI